MASGKTTLIVHVGCPTETLKSLMIYSLWFKQKDIDIVVVPMGVKVGDYAQSLKSICHFTDLRGALTTIPYRVTTMGLVDEVMPTVRVTGAYNAVFKCDDGTLLGDRLDDAGLVRGMLHKGYQFKGACILLSEAGSIGSTVATSLVAAGVSELALYDTCAESAETLGRRLLEHHPMLVVCTGSNSPDSLDVVVNVTPVGMREGDPLPFDVAHIAPSRFAGKVVMKSEYTPLLRMALDKDCDVQVGTDMFFEVIPVCPKLFSFGIATAEELRCSAAIAY